MDGKEPQKLLETKPEGHSYPGSTNPPQSQQLPAQAAPAAQVSTDAAQPSTARDAQLAQIINRSWTNQRTADDQRVARELQDRLDDEEDELAGDSAVSPPQERSPTPELGKHTPRKGKGAIAYDPEYLIDREAAQVYDFDPTKLKIDYRTRKPDPVNPDEWIESTYVRNRYGREVDWTNKASVTRLNTWREQILRRNFSKVRKERPNWTESERDHVERLVRRQLQTRSTIAWHRLANDFNRARYATKGYDRAGERGVAGDRGLTSFHVKGDRHCPWRTSAAIRGQEKNWPGFKRIITQAGKRRARGGAGTVKHDSSDEEELPDPNPGPDSGDEFVEKSDGKSDSKSGGKSSGKSGGKTAGKRSGGRSIRRQPGSKRVKTAPEDTGEMSTEEKNAAEKLESARALLVLQTGLSLSPAAATSSQAQAQAQAHVPDSSPHPPTSATDEKDADVTMHDPEQDAEGDDDEDLYGV